jgi:hypothetical protein
MWGEGGGDFNPAGTRIARRVGGIPALRYL